MKNLILILTVSLIVMFAILPQTTLSHGGRTNSKGCHDNHKTGDYHCHSKRLSTSNQYDRKSWPHWVDVDGDCQNTRMEILIRDSQKQVKFKRNRGCNVSWGLWKGPYTGKTMSKPSDVDIDHVVPLSHAHKTGGNGWSRSLKRQFANDFENLLAVDDSTNQSKGSKSPVRWKPPLKSFWCEYATRWMKVKDKYGLSISQSENRSLRVMKREC